MNYLVIDFETYFDSEAGFTLKKMSVTEYLRDPRFKVFGAALAFNGAKARWCVAGVDLNLALASFNWETITVIAHNVKFDGAILAWKYGIKPAAWIDTQAMSMAVLGTTIKSHSLRALSEHLLLQPKGEMKTDGLLDLSPEQLAELGAYCVVDTDNCASIFTALRSKFPASQYAAMDWTVRAFLEPKLVINSALLEAANLEEVKRREAFFEKAGIKKSVFSSNVKFPELLRERGFDVPMKTSPRTKKEIPALAMGDVEFRDMLEGTNEELRMLCEARVAAKNTLFETRTKKLGIIGKTGPWPFDVRFSGAMQTHRLSGGSGAGGNPQNFTRDSALREAVEAPKGYVAVVGDFSNIELRIQAYLSKDPQLMGAIERGEDVYCKFASEYFKREITKADEKERRFGKCAVLGLGYGMGWEKFKRTVRLQLGETISDEEAKQTVDLYRSYFAGIPAYWRYLENFIPFMVQGKSCNFPGLPAVGIEGSNLRLPSGLLIRFPGLKSTGRGWAYTAYKQGRTRMETMNLYGGKLLENICQGLAGELCKEAIERIESPTFPVCGQVHDEIIGLAPEALAEGYKAELYEAMTTSPAWWPQIRLDAECGYGLNWKEAK